MTDSPSTQILIERIQRGDDQAKDELYDRCLLPVLFLVRVNLGRRLRAKLDSWDIVQEALMKSLNGLDDFKYECDDAFRRYLTNKVKQVIKDQADYWSAEKRDPNREVPIHRRQLLANSQSDEFRDLADNRNDGSPSELLSLDEDLGRLAEALDELAVEAPDVWEVIVAAKVVGSRLTEIAEEKGVSADAIKMKLRRGMVKLAKIYRKLEDSGPRCGK